MDSNVPKDTKPQQTTARSTSNQSAPASPVSALKFPHARQPKQIALMQRAIGNRATQRFLQRVEDAPTNQATPLVAAGGRQPTPVQVKLKGNDYVGVVAEGQLEHLDPTEDPNAPTAPISAGEFGNTIKKGGVELSGALLKGTNPLDETINNWLSFGPGITVSSSLAAFKLTSDMAYNDLKNVELGMNFGEIEVALQGKIDHHFMKTPWGQRFLGGSKLGDLLEERKISFSGTIKLSFSLPAEDALRLAQAAANHLRLKKMAYQNSKWIKKIAELKAKNKQLMAAWKAAKNAMERMNIGAMIGENRRALKQLGTIVAKNKKFGRKLIAETMKLLKGISKGMAATLKKFIPILNLYFLASDVASVVELAYGLVSGKGYTFSLGGEEGGDGSGDDLDAGSAAEGEGIEGESAEENAGSADPEFAGLEDEAAGGGDDYQKPVTLNANAELVYQVLMSRNQGWVSNEDIGMIDQIVGADLTPAQMERLLATLNTAKLGANPFKNLTRIIEITHQAKAEPQAEPSQDGTGQSTGGSGQGQGTATEDGAGGGGNEEADIILLEDDPSLDKAGANSAEDERVDLNVGEQNANAPVPAQQGDAKTAQPPQIDPDIRDFMKRALVAITDKGMNGYAEFGGKTYNELAPGDTFTGMVTVQIQTPITDGEGNKSVQNVWYGGQAQFKVLNKLGNGHIEVIRSVMQGYNQHGRFVGTIAAAKMTVESQGELSQN